MTIKLAADYMYRQSPATLHSLGVTAVSRYHSDYPSKNLTYAEALELSNAGIDVVSNWENDVNDYAGGYSAGVRNANVAASQQSACGGAGHPIYFSVDTDVNPTNVADYFRGICAVLGVARVGVYGSTAVCRYLHSAGLVKYTWRTMSTGWSGGQGDPSEFSVEQTGYFNSNIDRDATISDDFGQWRVGVAPSAPSAPAPSAPTESGDDLPSPHDVWAYTSGDHPDVHQTLTNAQNAAQQAAAAANAANATLAGLPEKVWSYASKSKDGPADAPDVHQSLLSCLEILQRIATKLGA